jgi:hypothetical protein
MVQRHQFYWFSERNNFPPSGFRAWMPANNRQHADEFDTKKRNRELFLAPHFSLSSPSNLRTNSTKAPAPESRISISVRLLIYSECKRFDFPG